LQHLLLPGAPGEKAWKVVSAQEVVPGQEAGSGEGSGWVIWINTSSAKKMVKKFGNYIIFLLLLL
jgi:hypothetical protein